MGLSIALDAVKLHGGVIEVSSEEEKGSTFTIVLPYDSGTPPVPETVLDENHMMQNGGEKSNA